MASVPEEYLCPINLTLMNDPVIGSDGRSYERAAITQWLSSNPRSPLTREQMTVASLKPNYALKTAIERFNAEQRRPMAPRLPAPLPAPSAPPTDDVYYAIQVHQDLNQHLLAQQNVRYGPTPVVISAQSIPVSAERRQKQACAACLCLTIIIIFIIIVSRLLTSNN
jgi:hypothetical protein